MPRFLTVLIAGARPRRGANLAMVILAAVLAVGACGCPGGRSRVGPPVNARNAHASFHVRLDHLERLGLDATVRGRRVRVVALYAQAPDYRPVASPLRDGSEGIACVDDAARAAIVYLESFERTGARRSLEEAVHLLDFVVAMEGGDGELVNFIHQDGSPNVLGPTSAKSFSYWAARALWALSVAVRVFGLCEPTLAAAYRPALDRCIARLTRDIEAQKLVGGSTVATAEALLGVLEYQRAEPSPRTRRLAEQTALLLACATFGETPCRDMGELVGRMARADLARAPWGGRTESAVWHAWGARATGALARAGMVLNRPELVAAARQEADVLWTRMVLARHFPAEIPVRGDGEIKTFPQIAYGLSPIVEGFLALADATSDTRYSMLGGLVAAWFFGDNPANVAMYDEHTGRTFDGIDAGSLNRNAGAESTVEALLALGRLEGDPIAQRYARFRSVGHPASVARPGARRDFFDASGTRASLIARGEPLRLFTTIDVEGGPRPP